MAWLRPVLGAALAGTALWLLWVLSQVAGWLAALAAGAALAGTVLALALHDRSAGTRRRFASGAAAMLAALTVLIPVLAVPPAPSSVASAGPSVRWQPFDPGRIRREVAAGKLVFVDVTAAWCLTCKVNEAAVLDRAPVAGRLGEPGVVAMRADRTRPEPQVTAYLQGFRRYGVPLGVVYGPERPEGEALPELLSASAVLGALDRAAGAAPKTLTER